MPQPVIQALAGAAAAQGQDRLALDNLIRRELKVGDPGDASQVAAALVERYREDPRAQSITQESRGLPFLQAVSVAPVVQMLTAAGGAEWKQALSDIERDLASLTTDAILKDVAPELRGWAQTIRSTLAAGYDAARFALDPRNRDKGFAMRRQLNDFARLARLVGAHTPAMLTSFRKFAQSLDEAANLLIVIMGEALANVGFGGGRYVPQVAYSELQTRRDAAVFALRNLVGTTHLTYGPEDWPRGLDAYRQLVQVLEAQGQNDLRSLLVEAELARTMDELVRQSGDASADGLRAVGSTAMLALERFRRFIAVARHAISPESPALYAFLEALDLFRAAFETAGGFRLMKIARPPILFYGLYGSNGLDAADQRLVNIVARRGLIADGIDCVASACCDLDRGCLALLDKALYDIDRAIDLYSLGFTDFGATERRASGYAYVIDQVLVECPGLKATANGKALRKGLREVARMLRPRVLLSSDDEMRKAVEELSNAAASVFGLPPARPKLPHADAAGNPSGTRDAIAKFDKACTEGRLTIRHLSAAYGAISAAQQARSFALDDFDAYVYLVREELSLQLEMERGWSQLVHSLVANCSQIDGSLERVQAAVRNAVRAAAGAPCDDGYAVNLPPTLETSFDSLVDSVERSGLGRPHRRQTLQRRS